MYRLFVLALLLVTALSPAAAQDAPRSLSDVRNAIERVIDRRAFDGATWGVVVIDLDNGGRVYSRNPSRNLTPASTLKLLTTAAALDHFGPNYRWVTRLYAEGEIERGALRGNLIVRGSGDPSIGRRFHPSNATGLFRDWARMLKEKGITRIEGDIIGDDDVFDDVGLGKGWTWDDGPFWYAAPTGGLVFNDNAVDFTIKSTRRGQRAQITWAPYNTDYVRVINNTLTTRSGNIVEGYDRDPGSNVIRLSSRVPVGKTDLESLSIDNGTTFFVSILKETFERNGIKVDGEPVDVDELSAPIDYRNDPLTQLAEHRSVPLSAVVDSINKASINLYAEQVMKSIGAYPRKGIDPAGVGSIASGRAIANRTFYRAGIDTVALRMDDASGLSRGNLVSAEAMADLLAYMWRHPDRQVRETFIRSLPVGGRDGSLKKRFTDKDLAGRILGKTGTIGGVSGLAGYVETAGGKNLAYVILCNNFTTATAAIRNAQDQIVAQLARWNNNRPQ